MQEDVSIKFYNDIGTLTHAELDFDDSNDSSFFGLNRFVSYLS
jgi:hypothetical protein